jgi:hypothetical protein
MSDRINISDEDFESEGFTMSNAPPDVYLVQRLYSLNAQEFNEITKSDHPMKSWALSLGLGAVIPLLIYTGKHFYHKAEPSSPEVEGWEWFSVVLILIFSLGLWVLALALPSKKKKIISKINSHFEEQSSIFASNKNGGVK